VELPLPALPLLVPEPPALPLLAATFDRRRLALPLLAATFDRRRLAASHRVGSPPALRLERKLLLVVVVDETSWCEAG